MDLLKPKDGYSIFQAAQRITPNVIMFLPRNVNLNQVEELSWLSSPPLMLEIEENYLQGYFKGITVYFGTSAHRISQLSPHDSLDIHDSMSNDKATPESKPEPVEVEAPPQRLVTTIWTYLTSS
ncbi:hypothetical protein SLEP1_g36108 [Rubroshorea leprosula]|uniref:Trimethylguanosine synthase n=1 Tax=Rubroshorea leprosula TaxID=152421 RepID=A0AAV5KQP5_9ROSI|nr:hypothetical protein SLEP1_g36108 [Rubroshorea leprosula]